MTEERLPLAGRWWRLRLRTTLLLVVGAALVLNLARDLGQMPSLARRAARDHWFGRRELAITDPAWVAAIELESRWGYEDRWDVYLPPGGRYRLCLATRVWNSDDRPSSFRAAPIVPGRHILSLDQQPVATGWRVAAIWDRAEVIAVNETPGWFGRTGWAGFGAIGSHRPVGDRIPITHRRFFAGMAGPPGPPTGPDVEGPGLQVWVESEPEGAPAAGSPGAPDGVAPAAGPTRDR